MKYLLSLLFIIFFFIASLSRAEQVVFIGGSGGTAQNFVSLQKKIPEAIAVEPKIYWPLFMSANNVLKQLTEKRVNLKNGVILVGYCWGGLVARQMEADNPGLARKVITVGTPSGGFRFAPNFIFTPDDRASSTPLFVIGAYDSSLPDRWYGQSENNDGTVTLKSVLAIERPATEIVIFSRMKHGDIMNNPKVIAQILQWVISQ